MQTKLSELILNHRNALLNIDADPNVEAAIARLADAANAILAFSPSTIEEDREKAQYLLAVWDSGSDTFGAAEMRVLLESLAGAQHVAIAA